MDSPILPPENQASTPPANPAPKEPRTHLVAAAVILAALGGVFYVQSSREAAPPRPQAAAPVDERIAVADRTQSYETKIKARTKTETGQTIRYEGDVRWAVRGVDVRCETLTVLQHDDPLAVIAIGEGKVELQGMPGYPFGAGADRFTFSAAGDTFSLAGNVRLLAARATVKLRTCTLSRKGDLVESRSWLDDFRNAKTTDAKLDLLPQIAKVYTDAEQPAEVRYMVALNLLRPHLTWHAPYLPAPVRQEIEYLEKKRLDHFSDDPWQEAFGGDEWLLDDVKVSAVADLRAAYAVWNEERAKRFGGRDNTPLSKTHFYWRVRDPKHADVRRAVELLQSVGDARANRWLSELRRNNTVLTFDVAAGAARGKAHSLLMDVRNADAVSFKLYRVERPDEVLFALQGLGNDFVYRDHHLDDRDDGLKKFMEDIPLMDRRMRRVKHASDRMPAVEWQKSQLVRQWDVRVAELKHHTDDRDRHSWRRYWRHHDWYDQPDSDYFDDECSEFRERLERTYQGYRWSVRLSSWQCDRIVTIPETALADAGAYVLVAEANGQTVHVPIVVDPLSLTMRRCRDGVFAAVSDRDGKTPLQGATVLAAQGNRRVSGEGAAQTDAAGVAFARVLAYGDRPIVAHHQGRYAIGGFGELFEGIYDRDDDRDEMVYPRKLRDGRKFAEKDDPSAAVYEDQVVVVGYTDRPTYRPGQNVNFKLIVRRLLRERAKKEPVAAAQSFRARDFDVKTTMTLPDVNEQVSYDVFDPKGHSVANGVMKLSDFGTAAGSIALNGESVAGTYSLSVHVAGKTRLVPEVFQVQNYRRPNFEVKLAGVPETLEKTRTLTVKTSSKYYFGSPVANAKVEVRLVRKTLGKAIVEANGTLDDKGQAVLELDLPTLEPGAHLVTCSVTDESGRTVSTTAPLTFAPPGAEKTGTLATLPRFHPLDQDLRFATNAEVRVETVARELDNAKQNWVEKKTERRFPSKDGIAAIKFQTPGWHYVIVGDDEKRIFVYGKSNQSPWSFEQRDVDDDDDRKGTNWVNLSDFSAEDDYGHSRWERSSEQLYVLFDRQAVKVGENLRALTYVPYPNARILFTIEGHTVYDYAVAVPKAGGGAYQVVEIPIKDRYLPNFYLQGRLMVPESDRLAELKQRAKSVPREIRYRDRRKADPKEGSPDDDDSLDPRWCRIDVVVAPDRGPGDLNVKIETNQQSYRPGDTVRATVKVTDRAGRPQEAEVSLAAVDESVFSFGDDNLDAVAGVFRAQQAPRRFQPKAWRTSVGNRVQPLSNELKQARDAVEKLMDAALSQAKSAESINKLEMAMKDANAAIRQVPLPALAGEMPIGQIPLSKLREQFQETAAWLPQLRTDAAGNAQATFKLPDSLTRYRLSSLALTMDTEIGVGRSRIEVGLPLAVQVFLPRFGVENDRVLAVAVVRNTGDEPRDGTFSWRVEGAKVDGADGEPADWKVATAQDGVTATGRLQIPAKGTAKIGVWLKLNQVGTARVSFRATDQKETDAELRLLPVHPVGRYAEFHVNKAVAPGDKGIETRVKLPAGFAANDLRVGLTVVEVEQALDGLDYLVDFPYGCIEQTMSRFLPAVMVKHATQKSNVVLQPDVAKKLPDVLATGLSRLAGHQKEDGSWGWFKGETNMEISVYVVYGLARCQATGTKVDPIVLRRGCDFLKTQLTVTKHPPALIARAWYALALAGQANAFEFDVHARHAAFREIDTATACNLALACRTLNLPETGDRLWARVSKKPNDGDVASLSLLLNTQVAFGAPYVECRATARKILAQRHGMRWYHTRDTSWAVEALANMFNATPANPGIRRLEVTLDGATIFHVKDADLKKSSHQIHLTAAQLKGREGSELVVKSESGDQLHLTVSAVGVQRQDVITASGTSVKLERVYETLAGQPLTGAVKVGDVVRVRLRLNLAVPMQQLLIEDRRPALCEYAADVIDGSAARLAVHEEFRDDRLCVFFDGLPAGMHEIVYHLRAETPGQCSALQGHAYPMYDEKLRGETAANKIEVLAATR